MTRDNDNVTECNFNYAVTEMRIANRTTDIYQLLNFNLRVLFLKRRLATLNNCFEQR